MDVGFPLPGASLSSVMRFDPLPDDGGALAVVLTTRPLGRGEAGDAGIWFATRRCALRLPFQETIRVWAAGMAGVPPELAGAGPPTAVLVRQELRMFGIRCLTLDYQLRMDGDLAA